MTLTIDPPVAATRASPASRLRGSFAAVRLSFTWLRVRKTLTAEQKSQTAESFGAEGPYLSATKKLLDTRDTVFRSVTALNGRIVGYWRAVSLPLPEPGLRLIRQDRIQQFDQQLRDFSEALAEAVAEMDQHFETLKLAARKRLGSLYCDDDYPSSLQGLFGVQWDYPSVEAPQ